MGSCTWPGSCDLRVLQLPQQQPGGLCALGRDRLGDGGQPDHIGQFVVVEADDRHVVGHPEPVQSQRPQRTHGHFVGLREHRRRWAGGGEQFGHGALAALDRVAAVRLQGRVIGQPGVRPAHPGTPGGAAPVWSSAAVRCRPADHADPAVAEVDQMPYGALAHPPGRRCPPP